MARTPTIFATIIDIERAKCVIDNGATDIRINCSHMPVDRIVELLSEIKEHYGENVPRCHLDLQGGKMRISGMQPKFEAVKGTTVRIVPTDEPGTAGPSTVTSAVNTTAGATPAEEGVVLLPKDILELVRSRNPTFLGIEDGKIEMRNIRTNPEDESELLGDVTVGGIVRPRKGINFSPFAQLSDGLYDRDINVVKRTLQFPFCNYILSFATTLQQAKELLALAPGRFCTWKIEVPEVSHELMCEMCSIEPERTGIWFCRGDFGSQVGLGGLGVHYANFCRRGIPMIRKAAPACQIILAGEVMDHLCDSVIPTRSEVCHVAMAMTFGFDGFILSNETAFGNYPAEATKTLRMLCDYNIEHAEEFVH